MRDDGLDGLGLSGEMRTWRRLLSMEVCRATFRCGCAVVYSPIGHQARACARHGGAQGIPPYRVSRPEYLLHHAGEGMFTLTGDPRSRWEQKSP